MEFYELKMIWNSFISAQRLINESICKKNNCNCTDYECESDEVFKVFLDRQISSAAFVLFPLWQNLSLGHELTETSFLKENFNNEEQVLLRDFYSFMKRDGEKLYNKWKEYLKIAD